MNLKDLQKLDKDRLLEVFGLETRKGPADVLLPALGAFTVGVLVGAGIGLLLAPKPGTQLRDELGRRLRSEQGEAEPQAQSEVPSGIASGSRTL
jgi:hypothetical protein